MLTALPSILSALESKPKELLINDPANPGRNRALNGIKPASSRATANSTSVETNPDRPTLRETIAAQKKAKTASESPSSVVSFIPSARPTISSSKTSTSVRPMCATSGAIRANSSYNISTNVHPGTLSSAPVRPMRPARRLENIRPATVKPFADRKPSKDESSSTSPSGRPLTTKTINVPPTKSSDKTTASTSKMRATPRTRSFEEKLKKLERAEDRVNRGRTAGPAEQVPSPATSSEDIQMMPLPKSKVSNDEEPVVKDTNPKPAVPRAIQSSPGPTGDLQQSPAKNASPHMEPVIMHENADHGNESEVTPVSFGQSTALEGLSINEPTNLRSDPAAPSSSVCTSKSINSNTRDLSKDSEPSTDTLRCRRYLDNGITRIPQSTMIDHHGFRKLQDIIASKGDLWEDGTRFNQLLTALLENLEAPVLGPQGKASRYKSQVLQTISVMLQHHRDLFSAHYPQALCAMIRTRKYCDTSDRLAFGIEELVEEVTSLCESEESMDAILKLLEDLDVGNAEKSMDTSKLTIMGLFALKQLLYEVSTRKTMLNKVVDERLYALVGKVLKNTNADVRRAGTEYSVALHDYLEPTPKFWDRIGTVCKDQEDLITYYLVTRKAMTA